jgi:hypothetical protein
MAFFMAMSLAKVPWLVICDLATPVRPCTTEPPPLPALQLSDSDEIASVRRQPRSMLPFLVDLLEEEEHEVNFQHRQVR